MKRALYATTALVAVGLAASQASADSGGIKLGLSGFYRASAGFLVGGDQVQTGPASGQGDFGRDSGGFRQEIRINFKGQTTLDNGITVSVLVGVNAENTGGGGLQQNRSYVDFAGKYGDVRFGEGDSVEALKENCVYDPGNVTSNFGVNSANQNFSNLGKQSIAGSNSTVGVAGLETADATCLGLANKGTSIDYFSPSFGGFTFAVSYTPEAGHRLASGSQGIGPGTDLKNQPANLVAVGANYNHDFGGGWTLLVGGGGEWAFSGHTTGGGTMNHKPSTYMLGFQVGMPGGWTAGASAENFINYPNSGIFLATDAGTSGADGWAAAAGVAYTVDAWSVGLEGIYARYQTFRGGFTGAGACPAGTCSGHDGIWGIGLTGAYTLGPGINLEGMVAYSKYDPNVGTPNAVNPMSYDAVEFDAGVAVNF